MRKLHTYGPLVLAMGAIGISTILFVNMDTAKWIHSNLLETEGEAVNTVRVALEETEVEEAPKVRESDSVRTAITEMQVDTNPNVEVERRIVPPASLRFQDVPEDYFAKEAIVDLSQAGVLKGYEGGIFKPFSVVNRAEWSKMMVLSVPAFFQKEASNDAIALHDIQSTDWFSAYVLTLVDHKVVQGYADGTFRSGKAVTRAEALKMTVLASGIGETEIQEAYGAWTSAGNDIADLFQDVSNNQWFAPYMYVAHTKGLLKGKKVGDKNLAEPLAELSRGEAAVFLQRLRAGTL